MTEHQSQQPAQLLLLFFCTQDTNPCDCCHMGNKNTLVAYVSELLITTNDSDTEGTLPDIQPKIRKIVKQEFFDSVKGDVEIVITS